MYLHQTPTSYIIKVDYVNIFFSVSSNFRVITSIKLDYGRALDTFDVCHSTEVTHFEQDKEFRSTAAQIHRT